MLNVLESLVGDVSVAYFSTSLLMCSYVSFWQRQIACSPRSVAFTMSMVSYCSTYVEGFKGGYASDGFTPSPGKLVEGGLKIGQALQSAQLAGTFIPNIVGRHPKLVEVGHAAYPLHAFVSDVVATDVKLPNIVEN